MNNKKKKLTSNMKFDKKTAMGFSKVDYYIAQSQNMKYYDYIQKEKHRIRTPKREEVNEVIEAYVAQGLQGQPPAPILTLKKIYDRNLKEALDARKKELAFQYNTGPKPVIVPPIHSDIASIIARPEIIISAYRSIRGNKGAMTKASPFSPEQWSKMGEQEKLMVTQTRDSPDGLSISDITLVSNLLKKGAYPWGVSKRLYFDKPGDKTGKKRPITIPPFMDRVVQEAIRMVLEPIYEPWFEKRNRSFGFRPNKGVKDAMAALTTNLTNDLHMVIEGDISGAYDNVNKKKLVEILGKRIKDRKFLNLIKERLIYSYEDTETNKVIRNTELGIPQGGIDSPYLWNIYMSDFDEYVHTDLKDYIESHNRGMKKGVTRSKASTKNRNATVTVEKRLEREKKLFDGTKESKEKIYGLRNRIRILNHKFRTQENMVQNKKHLRMFYIRYADDWILLTNCDLQLAKKIKARIGEWLQKELGATLSEQKTLITDIRKEKSRFLGYEFNSPQRTKLKFVPFMRKGILVRYHLRKTSGHLIKVSPEKQRYINRLHMKGFCEENGFPRELPWLSCLEANVIIERYNAILRGMANDKGGVVPFYTMGRWIYIVTYSCLKTLAQKYSSSVKKIKKRFGTTLSGTWTVETKVIITTEGEQWEKSWTLLNYRKLKELEPELKNKFKKLEDIFWQRETGKKFGEYPDPIRKTPYGLRTVTKGRTPRVTDEEYLDKINWVNVRTMASFDMPCSLCGKVGETQMHHLKHVRKRKYTLIPMAKNWEQVMALRNRKQAPVCADCHRNVIHAGKYSGDRLTSMTPKLLFDNRTLHLETFVKKLPDKQHHAKTLKQKGWKRR